MRQKRSESLNDHREADRESCWPCRDLLRQMERFSNMPQGPGQTSVSDWLTVDEIATELRISKTIVYRLIRSGELEAVNIVANNGKISQKGHYRIKRASLNKNLDSKKVKVLPQATDIPCTRRFSQVKNHLGL